MNKNRKAHFTLMNVEAPPAAINEIERQERLSEEVLRYITIRVDELEEGPSAMMRKSIATIANATAVASAAASVAVSAAADASAIATVGPAP